VSAVVAPASGTEPAVRIADLGMVYPGGVRALEGIDLEVREGEFLAVLGLSGSGKSTLLRCINRLIDRSSGRRSRRSRAARSVACDARWR
jgi:ABC-type phosphate/phosphonate transport system ATPase subunit